MGAEAWPPLPYEAWRDAKETLHMFTQVVGKLRLALSPPEPEWQHVALYVTASGLTTGPVPDGDRCFEADLDLLDHRFTVRDDDGESVSFGLEGRSVSEFHEDVLEALGHIGVAVEINPMPQEVPDRVPFPDDRRAGYDPVPVRTYHRALSSADRVLQRYRAGFVGRHSRVQFFWGTFDLSYFRFSGRPVTPPPDAGVIGARSMDAELFGCGFWPGDERRSEPAFFAYAYPGPEGLERASVSPADGGWDASMGEFILPYEAVRLAADPEEALLAFLESTFGAAATLAAWPQGAPPTGSPA